MATSAIRSLLMKREGSFGDGMSTDFSGAIAVAINRAELTTFGDPVVNERDDVRAGFHGVAPDLETIGTTRRRKGKLTLVMNLEGYGTTASASAAVTWLLAAGMGDGGAPAVASEVAADRSAAVQTAGVTSIANWQLGGLIARVNAAGKVEFAGIVEKDDSGDDLIRYSPALSIADPKDETIRACRTFASTLGAGLGASLKFRADGHKWRTYCYGCRPAGFTFAGTGKRVQLTVELDVTIAVDDHAAVAAETGGGNVAASPTRTGGPVLHAMGAECVLSNAIDTTDEDFPRVPGRNVLTVDAWGVKITNTLEEVGAGISDSVVGCAELEIVNREVTVDLTVEPVAALDGDMIARTYRQLVLGWGPGGAGAGACVFLPAAYLTVDPSKRDLSTGRVRQQLQYREGYWGGDTGTATAVSNTAARIGLVVGANL